MYECVKVDILIFRCFTYFNVLSNYLFSFIWSFWRNKTSKYRLFEYLIQASLTPTEGSGFKGLGGTLDYGVVFQLWVELLKMVGGTF